MTHEWLISEKQFCFVAVPKTGCTSIIHDLFRAFNHPPPEEYHAKISDILLSNPEVESYFKCGFVRNPWDRLVSIYHDGIQDEGHRAVWSSGLLKYRDFSDFVINLPDSDYKDLVHLRPCSEFLTSNGKIAVDFIGRMETYVDDHSYMYKKVGVAGKLLHVRKSKRSRDYKQYYNPITKELVEKLYREDIERFGYEF